ncbi:MAG: hypothetical protein AAFW76_09435 [Pseudomonadota bacterium]
MGADRDGAVGVGAAEREIHAPGDILGIPVGGAVLAHGGQGREAGAVGIGLARPDVALVDVGVAIDEPGEDDAAAQTCGRVAGCLADAGDRSVGHRNVDLGQAVLICGEASVQQTGRHAGVDQIKRALGGQ